MTMDWSRSDGEKPADAVAWVPPWRRSPRTPRLPPPSRVFLATTGCFVGDDELRRDGTLVRVLAEDIAWRFSVQDWQTRRPPTWAFRRTRRWRAEYAVLAGERDRIAQHARFYGVPD